MFEQIQEENYFERVLSVIFPPALPEMHPKNDLSVSLEYHERKGRTGMDHSPRMSFGRVVGKAQLKRVLLMGPRTSWGS